MAEHGTDAVVTNSVIPEYLQMEDIQGLLFDALRERDGNEAKRILINHPELTNVKRIDDFEQEVTTPLLEACRYGGWFFFLFAYRFGEKEIIQTFQR